MVRKITTRLRYDEAGAVNPECGSILVVAIRGRRAAISLTRSDLGPPGPVMSPQNFGPRREFWPLYPQKFRTYRLQKVDLCPAPNMSSLRAFRGPIGAVFRWCHDSLRLKQLLELHLEQCFLSTISQTMAASQHLHLVAMNTLAQRLAFDHRQEGISLDQGEAQCTYSWSVRVSRFNSWRGRLPVRLALALSMTECKGCQATCRMKVSASLCERHISDCLKAPELFSTKENRSSL
ncbi:hypothetical protein BC835DRAFT_1378545 [Cytidiella melzeri]|nr:hypothetical protein BC835DRAFT_1378545 [Cytidiella melzeri]